jgi:hypothetical protein
MSVTTPAVELLVCYRTHVAFNGQEAVRAGELRRADDPAIIREFYVAAGTPPSQWPRETADERRRREEQDRRDRLEFERAAKANPVTLSVEPPAVYFRAKKDIVLTLAGTPATLKKGSTVLEHHEALHQAPDAFDAIEWR